MKSISILGPSGDLPSLKNLRISDMFIEIGSACLSLFINCGYVDSYVVS